MRINCKQILRKAVWSLFLGLVLFWGIPLGNLTAQTLAELLTVAEKSDFKGTSTSAEVEDFIDVCVNQGWHVSKFIFGQTVEGRDLIGVQVNLDYYQLGDQDERNVVLVLANIHSGECAGKEGVLMLLRELTANPEHPWLEENVLLFVPNYNADGNDRIGMRNRPGQMGPELGMGRRENAQDLDLNRDFMKLEAPETRALIKLIDQAKPHIFVDLHTTNGSRHRYSLTYDIPHNPATSPRIRQYMRDQMMPEITEKMAAKGQTTFYYGNFNRDQSQWSSYGYEPRFSTEYAGLRGCLAILSEAYSYISYQERITASKEFVASILDYATAHHADIRQTVELAESEWIQMADAQPHRVQFSLAAKATPFPGKFLVKGYKNNQPFDYECDFIGNYISSHSTPLPFAYIVPRTRSRVVDRLLMHGITVHRLAREIRTEFEIDRFTEIRRRDNPFQKHFNVNAKTERIKQVRMAPVGSYVIPTAQPLGRLASYLLEATSDDGLVFWNFFEDALVEGSEYPVVRIPDPMDFVLDNQMDVQPLEKLNVGLIDGPRSLLPTGKTPRWLGQTNLIASQMDQREVLLEGRTGAYAERPARPYDPASVIRELTAAGISRERAQEMLRDPLVATNGKYLVAADTQGAWLYFIDPPAGQQRILQLGQHNGNQNSDPGPPIECELFEFNPDESRLAFTSQRGLHILDLNTRTESLVPAPTADHLVGKLDWVYQEELYGRGNFKGYWWSPQGKQIAFLMLDQQPVSEFLVMDPLPVLGKAEATRYPKAGEPLPEVSLGVLDLEASEKLQWVDLSSYGDPSLLISRVTWSRNGEQLLAQIQNRQQTWLDLLATHSNGENPRVLFRDQTPAWIESPGDPVFVAADEFLWVSPRDGIRRIYRYHLDGYLKETLTRQNWEVRELLGVSQDLQFAFFSGSEDPREMHAYRLHLETGEIIRLTDRPGTHQLEFSHDFSLFLDHSSNASQPQESRVCSADGKFLWQVAARSDDRLDYVDMVGPEFVRFPGKDGQELDGMLIKPSNFSLGNQYPVLVHIYAGPHAPRVRNRFEGAFYLWHQWLAQQGYVVFVIDNRSASYRNTKDVWPIHLNMAKNELDDILSGVDWLKSQNWVASNRIGIWGWSYGGYMTLYAMTHSNVFKAGIAGAPVTDWKNYDAIYTERYMGLPQDNPEGYRLSSVLPRAHNLQGRLLLIHGSIDDNVHLNNSMQFVHELQNHGKQFDLMLYPAARHAVRDPKQAAHLRQMMLDFLLKNL
jgi:dipeptidyl-peptidase-4